MRASYSTLSLSLFLALAAGHAHAADTPITETHFGITTIDDHRWMEDPANAERLATWMKARSAEARAGLAALPKRASLAARLKEVSAGLDRYNYLQTAGDVAIYRLAKAGDRTPKLYVRQNGKDRLLFDPDPGAGKPVRAISNANLSPDGRYVALNLGTAGGEIGPIEVLEISTGTVVATIDRIWGEFPLVWLGGDRIGYTQIAPAGTTADPMMGMISYVRSLRGRDAAIPVMSSKLLPELETRDFPILDRPPGSDWVIGLGAGARAEQKFWLARVSDVAAGRANWKPVATLRDRVSYVAVHGNDLAILTNAGNDFGTVEMRSIAADGSLGVPREIMRGTERQILKSVSADRSGLYVEANTDGAARLFHLANASGEPREIALPFESGELYNLAADNAGNGLNFALSGWLTNARLFTVREGKLIDSGLASTTWSGVRDLTVDRLSARSADGTDVPLVVIRKAGALPAGGSPTLLDSYGGYGVSTATPFYNRMGNAFVAEGGVLAYCGVRGGGERGRPWHEGGRGLNKSNGHADFIACAQTLNARGIASSRGPVAMGTSMGGTLIPPAVLKKPEVFSGLVPRVGILNATRIAAAPNGANQFAEMGDPSTAEGYRALAGMDAYQMLRNAKDMPDTLLTIGLTDNRVAPWMSAKFAARAAERFPKRTVWLRVDEQAGHGIGSAEEDLQASYADIYAFVWDRSKP